MCDSAWKPARSSSWMRSSRCASVQLGEDRAGLGLEQLLVGRARVAGRVRRRSPVQGRRIAPSSEAVGSPAWPRPRLHPARRRRAPPPAARARHGPVRPLRLRRALDGADRPRGGDLEGALYHYFPSKQAYFAATLEEKAGELATLHGDRSRRCRRWSSSTGSLDAFLAWVEDNARPTASSCAAPRRSPRCGRSSTACATTTVGADPRRASRRGAAPRRRCAPPCARGCGSWTARPGLGRAARPHARASCTGCCSGRCSAR